MLGVHEVLPGIYQLRAVGSSIFVIVGVRITLVDAGGIGSAGRVLRFLHSLGRRPGEVGHIVVTHHHLDHTGSLARLQQETGALVAAHRQEIPFLTGAMPSPFVRPVLAALTGPIFRRMRPRVARVDVALEDGQEIEGLEGFRVLHTPGHTPGSLSLYSPDRELLVVGDALEARGRLGGPSKIFTMDAEAASASIARMAQLPLRMVCFSHFPPFTDHPRERLQQLADRSTGGEAGVTR